MSRPTEFDVFVDEVVRRVADQEWTMTMQSEPDRPGEPPRFRMDLTSLIRHTLVQAVAVMMEDEE